MRKLYDTFKRSLAETTTDEAEIALLVFLALTAVYLKLT